MSVEIISKQAHSKGKVYTITVRGETVKILFLFHAIERVKKWKIKEEIVAETLLLPEEVVTGHRGRYIAHRRYGSHLIRAVYEYEEGLPILLTVYCPHRERYFEGGGVYEDKIFKGS